MTDKPASLQNTFEALVNSTPHLRQLSSQTEHAQQQHASLLNQVLDAVAGDPSQLSFGIVSQKKTIAQGALNQQTLELLRVIASAIGRIPPGEGAGCPDRAGCVSIGQFGEKCFYLCKTVK